MSDPAGEERLRSLLTAAAAPAEPGELPGERQALADFRAAVQDRSRRSPLRPRTTPFKAAAVVCAGVGALLVGGTAAAATGVLPDAAQDTARTMLEKVGVAVPGADDHSAGHADQRGGSEDAEPTTSEGQGEEISELAKETVPGPEHGATVSDAASGKEEQADDVTTPETEDETSAGKGEEVSGTAQDADADGGKGEEVAPVASGEKAGGAVAGSDDAGTGAGDSETDTKPERGGAAHSEGADDRATQQADEASGGRSTAGTDHRP